MMILQWIIQWNLSNLPKKALKLPIIKAKTTTLMKVKNGGKLMQTVIQLKVMRKKMKIVKMVMLVKATKILRMSMILMMSTLLMIQMT